MSGYMYITEHGLHRFIAGIFQSIKTVRLVRYVEVATVKYLQVLPHNNSKLKTQPMSFVMINKADANMSHSGLI